MGAEISPIEQNYSFLNLTGKTRGVGGISTYRPYEGGGVTGREAGASYTRAVDNLPKAQMTSYQEYLPAQAGYDAGFSTKTLIA